MILRIFLYVRKPLEMFYVPRKRHYENIVATQKDRVVTHVNRVWIKFDNVELCHIMGISAERLTIYIARKKLMFSDFCHYNTIRNICKCHDLLDDICSLSFRS